MQNDSVPSIRSKEPRLQDLEMPKAPLPILRGWRDQDRPLLRAIQAFALQDWLVMAYLAVLTFAVLLGDGPRRPLALTLLSVDIVVVLALLIVTRGGFLRWRFLSNLLYRLTLFTAILGTFLQLHYILPTAASRSVDAQVLAFDLRVFGFEPALLLDAYVTPARTEWFSFFYYGYFALLALHILPIMFLERRMQVLTEFSWGILLVYCVGQTTYLLVPGYGPYHHLAGTFHNELTGAFWWPLVQSTVDSVQGSARLDIFPSLHTAAPSFLTLFSLRHRKVLPFRYTWAVLGFFASQIIVATMFLRWHYVIDIIAGITLAVIAVSTGRLIASWEDAGRKRRGFGPVWLPLVASSVNDDSRA
ncbi:MAG: phosphatase PAP2 family protein [Myxococcales bacterium]